MRGPLLPSKDKYTWKMIPVRKQDEVKLKGSEHRCSITLDEVR